MKKNLDLFIKLSIEPIVAAIIGIIFFFPLNNQFFAGVSWIVGAYLALNNFTLMFSMKHEIESMKESLCKVSNICAEYLKVDDEDFLELRDDAVEQCIAFLRSLNEGTTIIRGNAYYTWLSNQVKKCVSTLRGVSAMIESNWVNDQRERSFYQDNVSASKRGVSVNRIFITTKERLEVIDNRKIILQHIINGLNVYVIWGSDITDLNLKPIADKGFLVLDDRIAFTDIEPPSETIGRAMKKPGDIKKYIGWYEQLLLQALPAFKALEQLYRELTSKFDTKYGNIENLKQKVSLTTLSQNERGILEEDFENWKSVLEEVELLRKK